MSAKFMRLAAMLAIVVSPVFAVETGVAHNRRKAGGRTFALLIGLNYDNAPELADYRLRYSVNDVAGVKDMLVRFCGVDPGDIAILTDADRPDSRLVNRRISELAARAGPADRIILFYSGHGVTNDGLWAMVPYGFQEGGLEAGLVWNRDLTRTLESSAAAEKIFICDSCFSGSEKSLPPALLVPNPEFGSKAPGADSANRTLRLDLGGWGDLRGGGPGDGSKAIGDRMVRLCSSGADQKSREFAPAEMGVFTSSMVEAVREWWKRTERGELTLGGMFRGIYLDVTRKGNHSPFLSENGAAVVMAAKGLGDASPSPPAAQAHMPPRPSPRPEHGYPGRVLGLLVGLRYEGDPAGTNRLRFTENDVNAVRDALIRTGGAEEADITVLTDADRPTRRVILRELRNLAASAGPDDRIVFFFSGHGDRNDDYANIVPHGYGGWDDGVAFSADIKPIMESSAAASKWMFIDACHSGLKGAKSGLGLDGADMMVSPRQSYRPGTGAAKAPFDISQRVPDLIRFTSSYGAETSLESSEIGMGWFSYYLAKAFTDPAADGDGDGLYTGDNLVDYMTPRMIESTGGHHRPRMSENGLNIVLASANRPPPPIPPDGGPDPDPDPGDAEDPAAPEGRAYALLVGLNYEGSATVGRLFGPENDVAAMRKVLLDNRVCGEGDITVLFDRDAPVREKIIAELKALAKRAGPLDRIVFYYSGHGTFRGEYGAIVPYEYAKWEDGVKYTEDIRPILESSAAAAKWMIMDTCCSGMKGARGRPDALLAALAKTDMMVGEREAYKAGSRGRRGSRAKDPVPDLIRFTGAYASEFTWEDYFPDPGSSDGKERRGFFTFFLCEALSGEAEADGDGLLTGGELLEYVQPRVMRAVWELHGALQLPRLSENGGDAVLAVAGDALRPGAAPPHSAANWAGEDLPALFKAALDGDYEAVKRLLDSGAASVNDADDAGWTALHYASTAAVAELLMGRGADANRQSNVGFTPLHTAAMLGRLETIVALLHSGPDREEPRADFRITDKWGKTAQNRALEKGNREIADILESL